MIQVLWKKKMEKPWVSFNINEKKGAIATLKMMH